MPPNVWIIAGEASGDTYGARLATELKRLSPECTISGMGGAAMRERGVELIVDSTDLAIVGIAEVFSRFPQIWRAFSELKRRAEEAPPDCVVLIDYPGFNLRFAKKLRRIGVPVIYYISPQVWAWGKRRLKDMARVVDKMLVIFPFETEIFRKAGLPAQFVGHPLVEILHNEAEQPTERNAQEVLLLPGSRDGEIRKLLPPMLKTVKQLRESRPDLHFIVALHSKHLLKEVQRTFVRHSLPEEGDATIEISVGETRTCMREAGCGLAASGTVTLEAAILGLPLVVVYSVNRFTYFLARRLVHVPYITLPNLVAGEEIYKELLQDDVCAEKLVCALEAILPGSEGHNATVEKLHKVKERLGTHAKVSQSAATAVLELLQKRNATNAYSANRT